MRTAAPQFRRQFQRRFRRGVTLLEITIAVIIMAVLVSFVVPSFSRVAEQNHVDAATQYLRSIWSAQRVYWLETRTFADSLAPMNSMGLIDPKVATGSDGHFGYTVTNATADTFTVTATRSGSGKWTGTLTITQDGEVAGFVTGGSTVLLPPGI